MEKRAVSTYCCMLLLFTVVIFRIYQIGASPYAAMASQAQGLYTLPVASARGVIYDRNMNRLVNREYGHVASVLPTPQAMDAVTRALGGDMQEDIFARFQSGMPFAVALPDMNTALHARGVDVFRVPRRYGESTLIPHIIGYLGSNGTDGAAGIERAYNEALIRHGTRIEMVYQMDARGHVMHGGDISVRRTGEEMPMGGVVLTVDRNIQIITQNALANGSERGAAVVMDVHTGDIIGIASLPDFNPNAIADYLEREDAPFINRAASGYNIGSVFKTLISAAALEAGYTTAHRYTCEGAVEVGGIRFRCNLNIVHGDIDMARAMEVSCNTYFIELGRKLDPRFMLTLMGNLGLGASQILAPGIETQP
ncbi:MAG: penicillin-binding transpeptidase domain-containing protein, partial [Oscillospiraceae bacterium]|nr:penicillin-binding transpeptidase domain-containing protein [Oscillospiraceae bacterium]